MILPERSEDLTACDFTGTCADITEKSEDCTMPADLKNLSMDFAVEALSFCETIKGHYSVVNQLERSATSIGANIREAIYAQSKADFVSKFQIALKECYETEYWLELFQKAGYADAKRTTELIHSCGVIRRILIASINTIKEHMSR